MLVQKKQYLVVKKEKILISTSWKQIFKNLKVFILLKGLKEFKNIIKQNFLLGGVEVAVEFDTGAAQVVVVIVVLTLLL